jgi:hypothetical protein
MGAARVAIPSLLPLCSAHARAWAPPAGLGPRRGPFCARALAAAPQIGGGPCLPPLDAGSQASAGPGSHPLTAALGAGMTPRHAFCRVRSLTYPHGDGRGTAQSGEEKRSCRVLNSYHRS